MFRGKYLQKFTIEACHPESVENRVIILYDFHAVQDLARIQV